MCAPEPPSDEEFCNCEHESHFDDSPGQMTDHPHMGAPAGELRAMFVGRVCDPCAYGHMREFIGK